MTRANKVRAMELLVEENCTVEMNATINNCVRHEFLALTDASHSAIEKLLRAGYLISLHDGKIIVDRISSSDCPIDNTGRKTMF